MMLAATRIIFLLAAFVRMDVEAQETLLDTEDVTANLEILEDCSECGAGLRHIITIDTSQSESFEVLIDSMTSIDDVFLNGDLITIMGELAYGGKELVVVNVEQRVVELKIRGYSVSLSEGKRYIVYQPWYPRMRPELKMEEFYIYDLAESAVENSGNENFSFDENLVVPYGKKMVPTSAMQLGDSEEFSPVLPGSVAWNKDDKLLAFVVRRGEFYHLATADLSNGLQSLSVCIYPLHSETVRYISRDETESYTPRSVEFVHDQAVRIHYYPLDETEVTVELTFTEGC